MRIRKAFAGAFLAVTVVGAYVGLAPIRIPQYYQSDKALHFLTFFIISTCFYWILETNRRRTLHLTLFVCTLVLGVGSEVLQGFLPNGRDFDLYDIVANVVGSLSAVGLCTWYHKRMLERKRAAKNYQIVPGEDDEDADVELGEGMGRQELGTTGLDGAHDDGWNNDTWENEDGADADSGEGDTAKTPSTSEDDGGAGEAKKRDD